MKTNAEYKLVRKQNKTKKLWNLYLNPGNRRLHFLITLGHNVTPVSILFPVNLTLPNADVDWVVVNLRHRGYFRVNYDAENWKALITQAQHGSQGTAQKSTDQSTLPIKKHRKHIPANQRPYIIKPKSAPHHPPTPDFRLSFFACGTILLLSSSTICSCCARVLLVLSPRVTLTLSSSGHP